MSTVLELIGIGVAIAAAFMWAVSTFRHRVHLSRCVDVLQRQRRLDRRLIGCVAGMEHLLDRLPPREPDDPTVPEELVGSAQFLFAIRQEARDQANDLSRHAVRVKGADVYLSKPTLAGRRCELAHGALVSAFQAVADATREYERGLSMALLRSGDGPQARALSAPVRLLDESAAGEVARLREVCGRALVNAADACRLRFESSATFDTRWPVRRSEVPGEHEDPYQGELRPLGWQGFGPQPMLHVDAK